MENEKETKLWRRYLSCGHTRDTNIAFIAGVSSKPVVGSNCYCRNCFMEVIIERVEEVDIDEQEEEKV